MRDTTLLRAWVLALLIQTLGVQVFTALNFFVPDVPPFFWMANFVGGFAFGIGMVMAGGCASGTCYRVGEGLVGSLIAFIGFGLAAVATDHGALQFLQNGLRSEVILIDSAPAQLTNLLSLDDWVILIVIALPSVWWLLKAKFRPTLQGWSWFKTGTFLGFIALAAWLSSSAAGRAYGISINGPIRSIFEYITTGKSEFLDWGSFLILGLILGAFVASRLYSEAKLRIPSAARTLQALGGGMFMGFGAQVAGGCTLGHAFTGLSVLAMSSITTTLSIVTGAWLISFFLFMDGKNK
jgi:hypothetical protein